MNNRETNFTRSAVAGGVAACSATVVFHPIDTIKTILQRGGTKDVGQILKKVGGFRGLYVGVNPAAVSMAAACAVRMGSYEVMKEKLLNEDEKSPLLPLSPPALIGVASGLSVVVSAMVRSPLELVKTQMQTSKSRSSIRSALQTSFGDSGIVGLYRGAHLALFRDVPFFTINLVLYEKLKFERLRNQTTKELSFIEAITIGGISQGISGIATNPIDVLKTRVQSGLVNNFIDAHRSVLNDGGMLAYMRGAMMRTIWIAPQGCIYYPVYEFVQNALTS
jgi:hypothetical protein